MVLRKSELFEKFLAGTRNFEKTSFFIKDIDGKKNFSGMIKALSYGAPPHGGMAPGIDRMVMLIANEPNIREVTLFPMNQQAQDLLMHAPSEVTSKQLKELFLSLRLPPKEDPEV